MHLKSCNDCGEEKPFTEYYKHKGSAGGVRPICKSCWKLRNRKYYKANTEAIADYGKKVYLEKKSDPDAWEKELDRKRVSNLNRTQLANRRSSANKHARKRTATGQGSATETKRRAAKLQRTPSWANDQLIAAYYKEAKRLEELTGIQFHVDHIIPLQGEMVSGLHVETNLQLLPAHENIGKSNRFDPETFAA